MNVALGPGINVARVGRNGRAAEYISSRGETESAAAARRRVLRLLSALTVPRALAAGEEPALGVSLGAAYVRGLQGERVAASAKHFVANSQETRRNSVDAIIDERTLHEVYYPAFEAAVKAGVASVMCS